MTTTKKKFGELLYAAEALKEQSEQIQTYMTKTERSRMISGVQTIHDLIWEAVLSNDELTEYQTNDIDFVLEKVLNNIKN